VTTTATSLDAEPETRMLSLAVADTLVFQSLARSNHSAGAVQVDYDRWRRLQRWLAASERNVVIPFAEQLADRVLALSVRQRRDFGAMLTLIRAHALLHRASRAARPDHHLHGRSPDGQRYYQLGNGVRGRSTLQPWLSLDKSAASRRLRDATERGYIVNLETRRGRPARIVLGDPMPEMVKLLPEPGKLAAG
jgi:hypothetical protein